LTGPAACASSTLSLHDALPILAPLQGYQKATFEEGVDADGNPTKHFSGFTEPEGGAMSPEEYDEVVRDIVNFMVYVAEPVQLRRQEIGMGVLAFLTVLFVFAYSLKRASWRDVPWSSWARSIPPGPASGETGELHGSHFQSPFRHDAVFAAE